MAEDMLARCRALEGACACGRTHRMRTREIYIGEDWQAHLQAQTMHWLSHLAQASAAAFSSTGRRTEAAT